MAYPSLRVLMCSLFLLLTSGSLSAREVITLEVGASAPDFNLPGTDGKSYSLESFSHAKLLFVVFTCNHCPTAQAYEERIKQIHRDYRDRGVAVVAISPNDPKAVRLDELGYSDVGDTLEDMKVRVKDAGFEFPYLYDGATQTVSAAFGVLATPHVYLFDEARKLRYVGRIDDHEIRTPKSHDARNAIEELLAGKKVSRAETRVFGCSTKWADKRQSAVDAIERWNQEPAQLTVVKPAELQRRLTSVSENYRLVNVWATWCAPCVEELNDVVAIHRTYRKRNFEVITVSADELTDQKQALRVLNAAHCSATNLILDADSRDVLFDSVDPKWKGAIPYTALIAPDGKVIHRVHDAYDPLELRKVIADSIGRTYAHKYK